MPPVRRGGLSRLSAPTRQIATSVHGVVRSPNDPERRFKVLSIPMA